MRKYLPLVLVLIALFFMFSACSKSKETNHVVTVDPPVIMEQVNMDSKYVARAYLESLFLNDKTMFEKCYPKGFVSMLEETSNVDVFEQYRNATRISGDIIGTADAGFIDYSINYGFDQAGMKSHIAHVTGFEYSDIGQIRLQKIKACFTNGMELVETEFKFIVYEINGSWYFLESA